MTCSGTKIIPLQFGSKHFQWTFQLNQVSVPILGADFLSYPHLLVDVAGDCLFEPSDPLLQVNPCPQPQTPKNFLSGLICFPLLKPSRIHYINSQM